VETYNCFLKATHTTPHNTQNFRISNSSSNVSVLMNPNSDVTSDDESEFEDENFGGINQQFSNEDLIQNQSINSSTTSNEITNKKRKRSPWANPSRAVNWTDDMVIISDL
jgi:hypothetical protein